MIETVRVAVVGAGAFGRNHLRVFKELPGCTLAAVVDSDELRRNEASAQFGCPAFATCAELGGRVDAAVVAVPTSKHASVGLELLNMGVDLLVEKPIAASLAEADQLIEAADRNGRILQVGHLERFNPAVQAVTPLVTFPLFFEVHRLSVFSPRSLDVDVIFDLMIHDLDILLALGGHEPTEIRAAGIRVLSKKVDIANVRLAFANGCVANLTASRVSTERVRKLRLFQPRQYISLDYQKQEAVSIKVGDDQQIAYQPLRPEKDEPLRLELLHFLDCVRTRRTPSPDGKQARRALALATLIVDKIEEHAAVVNESLEAYLATSTHSYTSE
jgi:predicted dehydrogenase